jgi:hypothetical protein
MKGTVRVGTADGIKAAARGQPSIAARGKKPEPRFNILAVNTTVFLVGYAAPIVDHTEQHEYGCRPIRAKPQGLLYCLKVRGARVEMPAIVAVLSLEADCRRLTA